MLSGRLLESSAELECMHYYRIHLLLLLLLLVLLFKILFYAPLSKKKKDKRSHYLSCGNSLLNHGNISMFNRA